MANYQSSYTGDAIDGGINKANHSVRYDVSQSLTTSQRQLAQANIGIQAWAADLVRFQNTRRNTYNVKTDIVYEGYLDETGTTVADSSYRCTDYVPVTSGQTITYRLSQNAAVSATPMPILAFYTTNKWYSQNGSVVSREQDYVPAMSFEPAVWTASADGFVRFVFYVGKPDVFADFTEIIPSNVQRTLEKYAQIDGYYPGMSVGTTEQIASFNYVEDKVPYISRTAGGSVTAGSRLTENIVGGSLVWNQIQASTVSRTNKGVTYTYADGKLTISGTASGNSLWVGAAQATQWEWHADHVYLIDTGNNTYSGTSGKTWRIVNTAGGTTSIDVTSPRQLVKVTSTFTGYLTFRAASGQVISPAEDYYPQVFDLTQMFGSAVADYVYSLETATAGAGTTWFKNLFPNTYYAYDAGSIQSVKTSAHKTSSDGQIYTYPLDPSLELRGIPKLDSANKLYYDGDTYEPDGTVTRKYGIVDLGTLNWTMSEIGTYKRFYSSTIASQVKPPATPVTIPNIVSSQYKAVHFTKAYTAQENGVVSITDATSGSRGNINIVDDAYSDAATFKTAVSGVYLVYELATPIAETADPFSKYQVVSPSGIEEYTDYGVEDGERDVAIPVGHDTHYLENLTDKLYHLPNLPEPLADGDYIVRITGTQMSVIPLPAPIPPTPTLEGIYKLNLIVTASTKTLSWERE